MERSSRSAKVAILVLGLGMSMHHAQGQTSDYHAWLVTMDTTLATPIRLLGTGDSTVSIIRIKTHRREDAMLNVPPEQIPIKSIRALQFRHEQSMLRALAVTLPIAVVVGAIAASDRVDDGNAWGTKTVFNPTTFAITVGVGLSVGLMTGSARKKMQIDGRQSRYNRLRGALDDYAEPR